MDGAQDLGIGRNRWAFEGCPQTLACVGLLGAGHATPTPPLLLLFYYHCLESRPCSSATPCFPGPWPPRSCGGGWVPLSSVPAIARGLPHPPPARTSGRSPGPLTFHHMSGEVTLAKAGMSLGAAGPPPLSDQIAGISLRERLGGLFLSFLSPGRDLSSPGCGCRLQTDGSSPEAPEGQLLPVLCFCGLLSVVTP